MIGDELDTHLDMLEDTDHLVERTGNRLQIAGKQLSKVAKGTKGCGKDHRKRNSNSWQRGMGQFAFQRALQHANSCICNLSRLASRRIMDDHYGPSGRSHHCHQDINGQPPEDK